MSRPDPLDQQVIAEFRARGVIKATGNLSLLLLHHVGARSGTERVTPLAYWPVSSDTVAVLASNRGATTNPHWYHNLIANPTTTAEIGTDTWAVHARVADPPLRRCRFRVGCDGKSLGLVRHAQRRPLRARAWGSEVAPLRQHGDDCASKLSLAPAA